MLTCYIKDPKNAPEAINNFSIRRASEKIVFQCQEFLVEMPVESIAFRNRRKLVVRVNWWTQSLVPLRRHRGISWRKNVSGQEKLYKFKKCKQHLCSCRGGLVLRWGARPSRALAWHCRMSTPHSAGCFVVSLSESCYARTKTCSTIVRMVFVIMELRQDEKIYSEESSGGCVSNWERFWGFACCLVIFRFLWYAHQIGQGISKISLWTCLHPVLQKSSFHYVNLTCTFSSC